MHAPSPARARPVLHLTVLAGLLLGWACLPARARPGHGVGPAPPWVLGLQPDLEAPVPAAEVSEGIYHLLSDHQVRVQGGEPVHYWRVAIKVLAARGLESAPEIRIDYDPVYERVLLHHVRLYRDGKVRDALVREDIQVAQLEEDRERRLYDGRLSLLLFVRDVRIGDVLDYAFSLSGSNPSLGGRFAERLDLGYSDPVHRLRERLLWPAGRPLALRSHGGAPEPARGREGDHEVYTWDLSAVPAVRPEDSLPDGYDPYPWVQASEFASWAEVVQWAAPLYRDAQRLTPAVEEQVAGWRTLAREDRVLAALGFVQDEVRYLGIETGPSSLEPHRAGEVMERRFGDCKDKTALLVTMLRALDVEAHPALVASDLGAALDGWLPSPYAFDHVIAWVAHGAGGRWLDPTMAHQGGSLAERAIPCYGRALVVREGEAALSEIPCERRTAPGIHVTETYTEQGAGATLDVESVYRGLDADDMRREISETPASDLQRRYLNFYARDDPDVRVPEPGPAPEGQGSGPGPHVVDDREANLLTIHERYRLPTFFRDGRRSFHAWLLSERTDPPSVTLRHMPLGVDHPLWVRHTLRVVSRGGFDVAELTKRIESDALRYRCEIRNAGDVLSLQYELETLSSAVSVGELPDHLRTLQVIRDDLGYELGEGTTMPGLDRAGSGPPGRGGGRWGAALLGALGLAMAWRMLARRRAVRRRGAGGRGESAG